MLFVRSQQKSSMFEKVQLVLVMLIIWIWCAMGQGQQKDRGKWNQKYDHQFVYEVGGKPYFYAQSSETDGNNWFIQELKSDGKMGEETDHGFWNNQYQTTFSFSIDKPYFFGQNSKSKNWFIQELLPDGKMGKETAHGFFNQFYGVMFTFRVGLRQYIYGQSADGNNYFIQEVLPGGKFGKETASGRWSKFYHTQFPFSINGKQYFYGQSTDNYYFIQEIKSDGVIGDEIMNGYADSYGSTQIPFWYKEQLFVYIEADDSWYISEITKDGKLQKRERVGDIIDPHSFAYQIDGGVFFYGQNSNNDWYIDQMILCEKPKQLDRRDVHDYRLSSWNMQGANNLGESKWATIVRPRMAENDIVALQESGAIPGSATPIVNGRAPVHGVGPGLSTIVSQLTWPAARGIRYYMYHVENGNVQDRTSMAIISRYPADQVLVLGPFGTNDRAIIGIRHGNDYFFNIHASAFPYNEVPGAVEAIEQRMSQILLYNSDATWIIMGDFNRHGPLIESQLNRPPDNVHREVIIPTDATHESTERKKKRIYDYAIAGSGVGIVRRIIFVAQTVVGLTLSDHNWVSFLATAGTAATGALIGSNLQGRCG